MELQKARVSRPNPEGSDRVAVTPADPAIEMENSAIRLLSQREHSRAELERKLARRFAATELLGRVLDELEQRGLLSDRRFTEQYVAMRMRKGFGPLRIRMELQERGIDQTLIEPELDIGRDAWVQHLRETAAQRFGGMKPTGRSEQAKQARFLQYRGFPESLIRDFLWG